MRTLIILTSVFFVGCAHNSNLQIVGSVYCESERPEGRAVAKVEVRYTPFEADQQSSRLTQPLVGDAHHSINDARGQLVLRETTARPDATKDWANLANPFTAMAPHELGADTEAKVLTMCQTLRDK